MATCCLFPHHCNSALQPLFLRAHRSLYSCASIMASHDGPPATDASELQPIVNPALTTFQPEFQHLGEYAVVTLSDLKAPLSAPPVTPILNDGDPRFVQLMSDLEAQLVSEAAANQPFDLDLPELFLASHRRAAPIDATIQPIQAAASVCNDGGGVRETGIDTPSSRAIPRRRTQSRVHCRPAAARPRPLTAGAEGSRGGSGIRAPRRASSTSPSTGSSSTRAPSTSLFRRDVS